jgi:hypothetical protein
MCDREVIVILNVTEGGVRDLLYLPVTNRREASLNRSQEG